MTSKRESLHEQLMRIRNRPVAESREKRGVLPPGPAPGMNSGLTRPFFCRTCGKKMLADRVPPGWYTFSRHTAGKAVRLGIYCSIDCFAEQMPRLRGIDDRLHETGHQFEGAGFMNWAHYADEAAVEVTRARLALREDQRAAFLKAALENIERALASIGEEAEANTHG